MYRVMLIDDEPWALYALQHGIDWEGKDFEIVACCNNAEEALEQMKNSEFDVVFTDVEMDNISGIELIRVARAQGIRAEFVIVSAYEKFSYVRDAIQYNIFDYIVKPIEEADGSKLLERLQKHLSEKKFLREQLKMVTPLNKRKNCESVNKNFIELLNYVEENFCDELKLKQLADEYYLDISYVCVLFKKVTGETFSSYVNSLRLKEAYKLLLTTNESISKVAEMAGYRDYYYFNKIFKKKFGCSPRQCRMQESRKNHDETNQI